MTADNGPIVRRTRIDDELQEYLEQSSSIIREDAHHIAWMEEQQLGGGAHGVALMAQ
jgi:hypothetical protein